MCPTTSFFLKRIIETQRHMAVGGKCGPLISRIMTHYQTLEREVNLGSMDIPELVRQGWGVNHDQRWG